MDEATMKKIGGHAMTATVGAVIASLLWLGYIKSPKEQMAETLKIERTLMEMNVQLTGMQAELAQIRTSISLGRNEALTHRDFEVWLLKQQNLNPSIQWSELNK